MKNAEILTEVLYYADAETNTKHKKKDAEVPPPRLLTSLFIDSSREAHKPGRPGGK